MIIIFDKNHQSLGETNNDDNNTTTTAMTFVDVAIATANPFVYIYLIFGFLLFFFVIGVVIFALTSLLFSLF